ncbi:MAG: iron-sulfur cluster assembly accessory protein [Acidobacteria bacterium]|nr:iron-sulfur cluster assembly accessory protein [Acidobacteriota bacterium]
MISVTPTAAARVKEILARKGESAHLLRVRVVGGGCSGLQYDMDFTAEPAEGDQVFEDQGVRICVDPRSALYLYGTVLDYTDALTGGGFRLKNPNAASSCGCGESFSV